MLEVKTKLYGSFLKTMRRINNPDPKESCLMSHPGHVPLGFEPDKPGFAGLHPRVEANLNPSCLTEDRVTLSTHRDVQARQVTGGSRDSEAAAA